MKQSVRRAALALAAGGTLVVVSACAGYGSTAGDGGYAAAATEQPAAAPGDAGDGYGAPASPTPEPAAGGSAAAPGALVARTIPKMGSVVTDAKGWVLYRFDKDTKGAAASACTGTCAKVWPPAWTSGKPALTGIDPAKVGTVTWPDGRQQLTLGGWALYRYAGDQKPGAWKGQGVSGTWWVAGPTGAKNLTCVPKGVPTPVAPPPATTTDRTHPRGGGPGPPPRRPRPYPRGVVPPRCGQHRRACT